MTTRMPCDVANDLVSLLDDYPLQLDDVDIEALRRLYHKLESLLIE